MTPSALDEVIWKAPDFWRYRGGYHILNESEHRPVYQAVEALSRPFDFSYQSKEELYRRKRINEYLLDKIRDQRERMRILDELGTIHFLLSEPRKEIEYYEKALKISRKIGDRRSEGNALWNMGLALKDLGDTCKAIKCAKSALEIMESIESPHAEKVKRKLQEWEKLSDQIQ